MLVCGLTYHVGYVVWLEGAARRRLRGPVKHRYCDIQEMADGSQEELALRQSIAERRARIADLSGDTDGHLEHLQASLEAQKSLVLALRGDYPDVQVDAQRRAAALAARVSALHEAAARPAAARDVHAAVLRICPNLHDAALAVARLDLRLGDLYACEERVRYLLSQPYHEVSDILFLLEVMGI